MNRLKIATRESPLAMWQAEFVAEQLRRAHPDLEVELLPMTTKGDQLLESPLSKLGGKGLFVKELERAMLDGHADIAVHSMKDVPAEFPPGLGLSAVMKRHEPFDALVGVSSLDGLAHGAVVGTASLRRSLQIKERRPDLQIKVLRGNVNTRLRRLDEGLYDAIVLAEAGLRRLGFDDRVGAVLTDDIMLPSIGQGALGIESRLDDVEVNRLLSVLVDQETTLRVKAERSFGACLGGSCQLPIAGFAQLQGHSLHLRGLVGTPDGTEIIRDEIEGPSDQAEELGIALGKRVLQNGGQRILSLLDSLP